MLDFYEKGTTVAQNEAAIRMADRAGLYTGGIFIIGAPFEERRHFEQTYRFAAGLPLDITTFWVLDYAYGSALWETARKRGILTDEEIIVPAGSERGTQNYSTAELTALCEQYFFRFFCRPSFWLRQIIKVIRVRDKYLVMVFVAGIQYLIARKVILLISRFGRRMRAATKIFRRKPRRSRRKKYKFEPEHTVRTEENRRQLIAKCRY
ncbi:MAG: hypothetical protein JW913_10370 [Chitinispirillaceae bacterium]|nr:hypothetical protein [Chitinispirillaceae bacterium]